MAVELLPLTDVQKTCLPTLYGKALDARSPDPILGDTLADSAVRQLDFDFSSLKLPSRAAISLPIRANHLDGWTREFLSARPRCAVLHLGCGLDTRVHRIDPPASSVQWYDVDLPEVISLREQLYPDRDGYAMIPASVTSAEWLDRVVDDRPVLVVAEGLVMHLPTASAAAMVARIVERFPSGQFCFDVYSALTARTISFASRFASSRAHLHWGLPPLLARDVTTLRLTDDVPYLALPELGARMATTPFSQAIWRGMLKLKFQRESIRHLRYEFG
ncbi:class I SAM-dependent methyltransferase [Flindersiella endophytica]